MGTARASRPLVRNKAKIVARFPTVAVDRFLVESVRKMSFVVGRAQMCAAIKPACRELAKPWKSIVAWYPMGVAKR